MAARMAGSARCMARPTLDASG
jgi:hypothetical protein